MLSAFTQRTEVRIANSKRQRTAEEAAVTAPVIPAQGTPSASGAYEQAEYVTRFGSLEHYEKGGVEIINDDPRHYAFSNVFDVAAHAKPYEKIAVGKNMQYVLEAVRAEGVSEWRTAGHDEFALVLDGEVVIDLVKLDDPPIPSSPGGDAPVSALEGDPTGRGTASPPAAVEGSIALDGEPEGARMGRVTARRGHMTLLPAGSAYRFSAERPGVVLMQTIAGRDTQFRWAEICQSL
jgi:hypothetical protein